MSPDRAREVAEQAKAANVKVRVSFRHHEPLTGYVVGIALAVGTRLVDKIVLACDGSMYVIGFTLVEHIEALPLAVTR